MDRLDDLVAARFQEAQMSLQDPLARLKLTIRSVTWEAEDILAFELVDPAGGELPAFEAGAHIDVHVAPHLVRQYSIASDPRDRHRYVIAVLREKAGRGGSAAMHEALRPGQAIEVSRPRNHFRLAAGATEHVLLAAGIGVTPMMAMAAALEAEGARWHMHYCTRTPEKTAFRRELAPLVAQGKVSVHHDDGDPARGLDLAATLAEAKPGAHLYYCGPAGFMAAVREAASHWEAGCVHFEHFAAPPDREAAPATANRPFRVKLKSTGAELEVPADKTIVQVLREHGQYVDTSCEDGYCGTCLTPYCDGEPEHRDTVLDEDDRRKYVLVCCARSKTPTLVLDL